MRPPEAVGAPGTTRGGSRPNGEGCGLLPGGVTSPASPLPLPPSPAPASPAPMCSDAVPPGCLKPRRKDYATRHALISVVSCTYWLERAGPSCGASVGDACIGMLGQRICCKHDMLKVTCKPVTDSLEQAA
eukprot:862262-Pelagomonas_calceolata.AAC.5